MSYYAEKAVLANAKMPKCEPKFVVKEAVHSEKNAMYVPIWYAPVIARIMILYFERLSDSKDRESKSDHGC
jgi:hypothetical protein